MPTQANIITSVKERVCAKWNELGITTYSSSVKIWQIYLIYYLHFMYVLYRYHSVGSSLRH